VTEETEPTREMHTTFAASASLGHDVSQNGRSHKTPAVSLRVGGLFAGIGGIELGLASAGLTTSYLCEIDPFARRVLRAGFPGVTLHEDVTKLGSAGDIDVLTAGFPCQDLSQAGRLAGIGGAQSGLVDEVFRVVGAAPKPPRWIVLENVPFMLRLHRGKAAEHLVTQFEALGYTWAYRVVDTRAFGLPQRRRRVFFVASKIADPRHVLFADDSSEIANEDHERYACGFYWTEGNTGVGWAVNAIPPLKGGSSFGIPSPPAIRTPRSRDFVLPEIRDAERLQGFPPRWTEPALDGETRARTGTRWRLVGNAVSVPVARWIGRRLIKPGGFSETKQRTLGKEARWPDAAWGRNGERFAVDVTSWPIRKNYESLSSFLEFPATPLSAGAAAGFLGRAKLSGLTFVDGFLEDLDAYVQSARKRR
jgi:DNA (cytosine-5)-methyltransferase 1